MTDRRILPLSEPVYSTYHYQGISSATHYSNPTVRNWFLNSVMQMYCSRRFLDGFTTPELTVLDSNFESNRYLNQIIMPFDRIRGRTGEVIRALIDSDTFAVFRGIDDYYIPGKSWYRERHFYHDGMICGYDMSDRTYYIHAYDSNWQYRVFKVPQASFHSARRHSLDKGTNGYLCAVKVKDDTPEFSPYETVENLKRYMDSSIEKYPVTDRGNVFGTAAGDYIVMYVRRLEDGSIPYRRTDRRVFRLIWEHKRVMLERLEKLEEALGVNSDVSYKYREVTDAAREMHMAYAAYCRRQRCELLPAIAGKLEHINDTEKRLIDKMIGLSEKELGL